MPMVFLVLISYFLFVFMKLYYLYVYILRWFIIFRPNTEHKCAFVCCTTSTAHNIIISLRILTIFFIQQTIHTSFQTDSLVITNHNIPTYFTKIDFYKYF